MATTRVTRRQGILLASLLTALAVLVAYQLWPASGPSPAARRPAQRARGAASAPAPSEVPDVHLEALEASRPAPVDRGRNLFRDQPEAPPSAAPPPRPQAAAPPVPTGPPPPPPITLKFVGVVQSGGRAVAVLSDGRDILYGQEGEVVDGQYLILKINVETIEVSYPDGTGRRVIRLTG
ncbi:MAG: hypothetical protein H6Q10_864 [Acidobacteria bacterium]|nr:hypothetical protein [Acidobacteriota bacterium]